MASELRGKLERIEAFINIDNLINGEKNSNREVRRYFRINKPAYRRFHSDQGFMHFRISKNGKIEANDVFYQPDTVNNYIPEGANVLELGPGQGANIFYLCNKRPDVTFTGIDLLPPKMPRGKFKNLTLIRSDYSNMSYIESESMDLVFGIETIVHCSKKDEVFSEVNRILKKDGIFIVYDYATKKEYDEYQDYEKKAIDLISKCGAAARIESDSMWEERFINHGFDRVSKIDYAKEIIPDLDHLKEIASKIMDNDKRLKKTFRFLPVTMTNNILIGYIGVDCYKEGIASYIEWIYKKK